MVSRKVCPMPVLSSAASLPLTLVGDGERIRERMSAESRDER